MLGVTGAPIPASALIDCLYFTRDGACAKMTTCKYRHNPVARSSGAICPNWQQRMCTDVNCNLQHPSQAMTQCFYHAHGGCRNGGACPFLHGPTGPLSAHVPVKASPVVTQHAPPQIINASVVAPPVIAPPVMMPHVAPMISVVPGNAEYRAAMVGQIQAAAALHRNRMQGMLQQHHANPNAVLPPFVPPAVSASLFTFHAGPQNDGDSTSVGEPRRAFQNAAKPAAPGDDAGNEAPSVADHPASNGTTAVSSPPAFPVQLSPPRKRVINLKRNGEGTSPAQPAELASDTGPAISLPPSMDHPTPKRPAVSEEASEEGNGKKRRVISLKSQGAADAGVKVRSFEEIMAEKRKKMNATASIEPPPAPEKSTAVVTRIEPVRPKLASPSLAPIPVDASHHVVLSPPPVAHTPPIVALPQPSAAEKAVFEADSALGKELDELLGL